MKKIPCPKCQGKGRIPDPKDRADLLRKRRELTPFSVRQVAEAMRISAPYLSDLERGNRPLNDELEAAFDKAIKALIHKYNQ